MAVGGSRDLGTFMAILTSGTVGVDFDALDFSALGEASLRDASSTSFVVGRGSEVVQFFGSGLVVGPGNLPIDGVIERIVWTSHGQVTFDLSGLTLRAQEFARFLSQEGTDFRAVVLAASDSLTGSNSADRLRSYDGSDTVRGGGGDDFLDGGQGDDQVFGGSGNDNIVDDQGANFLRGEEGDDYLAGGTGFDDMHGNMGDDVLFGSFGNDWVVGGRDQDLLFGEDGDDLVYGNLGRDTCDGGDGNDIVRGGQDNDSLTGGGGADYLSGDRGDDTIVGGAGADAFHSFGDAGIDRVLDFSPLEGDVVLLDAGTAYTVAQVGADTVITMNGAGQVVLVGLAMSSLASGSIIVG